MLLAINDVTFADAGKRKQLYTTLQAKADTLINECSMKGPEHDALHIWLAKVLTDIKELNEEDKAYAEAYAALKNDVESFYQFFE